MNTKNNRRRRASIDCIEKAFIDLLQTKELHQITVSDLCKKCALNRSTFYANFVDIYDLADKVRDHLEEDVSLLYEEEITKGFNSNNYFATYKKINCFTVPILNLAMTTNTKSNCMTHNKPSNILTTSISHITRSFSEVALMPLSKCGSPADVRKHRKR